MPRVDIQDRRTVILMPKGNLVGLVGSFPDELSAFPHFQYLKGLRDLGGSTVLMTVSEESSGLCYKLYVLLEDDLLSQTTGLVQLQSNGYSTPFEKASQPSSQIQNWREQIRLFDAAYDGPVKKRLLQLSRTALTSAVAKFIFLRRGRTDGSGNASNPGSAWR